MRVLWFTNNSCNYKASGGYHGGGWMSSLQDIIQSYDKEKVELGISFCMDGQPEKMVQEDVTYYPVPSHTKPIKDKILDLIRYRGNIMLVILSVL